MLRAAVVLAAAIVTGLAGTTAAAAVAPPPPPNPGDSQLAAAERDARSSAAAVDGLVAQEAEAQAALNQVREELAQNREWANKALVDLNSAQDVVAASDAAQAQTQQAVAAADDAVRQADAQATLFAVASYQQGSTIGSFSAYLGADSPQDVLERVALLNAVGGSQLTVISTLTQARARTVESEAAAATAQQRAAAAATAAATAKENADAATEAVRVSQQQQAGHVADLEALANRARYSLDTARQTVDGLQGQRLTFEQWDAQRRASDAGAAQAATDGVRAQILGAVQAPPAAQSVIARAASQLGVPYAWGGGNAAGPTVGIHDGGVADSYGDFNKVGFDCSGLMVFAFAAVGATLPHYTGYQYLSGRQVPIVDLQPGDMVFYGPSGGSHVALFIGNNKVIEAPESGSTVQVSDLRLGGIMPNAVRMT